MKLHYAAALALVGWYLMMPLLDPDNSWKLIPAPLSQWDHEGSYDTAAECMRAREELLDEFAKARRPQRELREMNVLGQCIASDDPRLAK